MIDTLKPKFNLLLSFIFVLKRTFIFLEESVLTPEDTSMWIGAWWLGFLILSPCLLATAFPLLFFPTKIPSSENVVAEEKCQPFIDYQVRGSSEVSSEQNLDEKEEGFILIIFYFFQIKLRKVFWIHLMNFLFYKVFLNKHWRGLWPKLSLHFKFSKNLISLIQEYE